MRQLSLETNQANVLLEIAVVLKPDQAEVPNFTPSAFCFCRFNLIFGNWNFHLRRKTAKKYFIEIWKTRLLPLQNNPVVLNADKNQKFILNIHKVVENCKNLWPVNIKVEKVKKIVFGYCKNAQF